MKPIFLDTSYLIALEAADDQHHQEALRHWQSLITSTPRLLTTSYVFDEIVTFFNNRNRHEKAVEVGNRLLGSSSIQLVHVDDSLFYAGWKYFKRHEDKTYSLTDCISFVVMEQFDISTVLTFDQHFQQAKFKNLP